MAQTLKTRYILMNQCALSLVIIIPDFILVFYFGIIQLFLEISFNIGFMIMSQSTLGKPKDSKNKHFFSIMIFFVMTSGLESSTARI